MKLKTNIPQRPPPVSPAPVVPPAPAASLDPVERELNNFKLMPPVPPGIYLTVAAQASETLANEADLAKLRELQTEWKRCHDVVVAHGPDRAKIAFLEAQKKLGERIGAGEMPDQDAWSLEDWVEDYAARMTAAKRRAEAITVAAFQISRPIIGRYIVTAHEHANQVEALEKGTFDAYGVAPFTPSLIVACIRASARAAANRVSSPPNWAHSPLSYLQFLAQTQ